MPRGNAQRPEAQYATDRFLPVFALLVLALAFATFVEESRLARAVVSLAVVVAVLATLRATGVAPRRMRAMFVLSGALAVVVVASEVADATAVKIVAALGIAAVLVHAAFNLVRRIFERPEVGVQQVVAALATYVETALAFSFTYLGVARAMGQDFFSDGIAGQMSDFVYFSVVTITTLGYGDLTPATDLGRSLVMLETLIGQILLVVLVAYLVGRIGTRRGPADVA